MSILTNKTRRRVSPLLFRLSHFAFLIFVVGALIFVHQSVFVIKSWECRYGSQKCPPTIEEIIETSLGRSVLRLNQNQIKKRIQGTGWGEEAAISFRLPGRLAVKLNPLTPVFPVKGYFENIPIELTISTATNSAGFSLPSQDVSFALAGRTSQSFALLPSGLLVEDSQDSNIYIINPNASDKDRFLRIHSFIKEIAAQEIGFQAIYFSQDMVIVKRTSPPEIIFDVNKDPLEQILALQQVVRAATIKDIRVVDFRFNHPILK